MRAFALAASLAVAAAMFVAVPAFANDDDNKNCPKDKSVVTAHHFTVNGNAVKDLNQNNVHGGDTVVAVFTIAAHCKGQKVTFASYNRPGGTDDITKQVLFDHQTGSFDTGEHSLTVKLPCSWQADLAIGDVIELIGRPDYYGDRLIDSGWGTDVCATPSPSASPEEGVTPAATTSPSPEEGVSAASTQSGVLAAAVTNPATGNGSAAFGGFLAVLMVLSGIAILAEVRRRRLRD